MAAMRAGEAVVRVLEAEGVKAVFGIPGGHTLPIYDALYDRPGIRHILVPSSFYGMGFAASALGVARLARPPTGRPSASSATAPSR